MYFLYNELIVLDKCKCMCMRIVYNVFSEYARSKLSGSNL